ncbi:DUF6414 family protein [Acinetobacter baumannii]|uniref:DUF6414 family protein n=1 Tax=Acinetobacter baumannii TaxID=470 RepID=UPI0008104F6D|nr:hypothetical protein [Acinetobacter baumannii]
MAQELQNIESIFDFFYLDNQKIKSYYAQLNGGAINSLKKISQAGDASQMEASLSIPAVANGKIGTSQTASSTSEHLYDAIPTMPREMINGLDELGFIHRELLPENLGSLVLLEGYLNITDVEVMKAVIDPTLKIMKNTMPTKTQTDRARKKEIENNIEPMIEFMKEIPFALSCSLYVENEQDSSLTEVWMSLAREDMSSNFHDINFKHGEKLAGKWYVLGVLDAIPNSLDNKKTKLPDSEEGMEQFRKALSEMMKMFGRSDGAYGLTPIAIFRVLKPRK